DDLFRGNRGEMQAAVAVIDDALAIFKPRARLLRGMACVGGSGRVMVAESVGHGREADGAGESSIADGFEFALPPVDGHPDFEMDDGDVGGLEDSVNFAKRGQIFQASATSRGEGSGGDRFGDGDLRVGEGEARESFAVGGEGGGGEYGEEEESHWAP